MDVIENDTSANVTLNNEDTSSSVNRLQNLVYKLEKENDIPSPTKEKKNFIDVTENKITNGNLNTDLYSLENTPDLKSELKFDADLDVAEDSWLYESPQKLQTPGKGISSPDKWLKDNISTPELMRVRGSLSAKLDVITIENRKVQDSQRKRSKGNMMNVNSLDWDYDEESQIGSLSRLPRQAWTEPSRKSDYNDPQPFSLDWSDDEDDLVPMKIDFNNPSLRQPSSQRKMIVPNGAIMKRSVVSTLATPRQGESYDYDDFVAKPQGGVKPRRAVQPVAVASQPVINSYDDDEEDITDYGQDDFDDSAPVVPRGAVKPRESPSSARVGIAKPAQIRKPTDDTDTGPIRLRGSASASNLIRPRGSQQIAKKVPSASDVSGDSLLKAKLPVDGDGPVVRRRSAPPPSASSSGPTPRKSKESSQIGRVQGVPQVRKSTGSIPQKSSAGLVKPRGSSSSIARPRGSGMVSQSFQANY